MVAIPTLRSYIYIRMKVRVGGGGWGAVVVVELIRAKKVLLPLAL